MGALKKRKSSLDRRLKRIDRELKAVRRHVGSLSKSVDRGVPPAAASPRPGKRATHKESADKQQGTQHSQAERRPAEGQGGEHVGGRDERFTDYLASSFQSATPLRHERRIQRNRAIFMIVFAALLLFLIVWKFFT